LVGDWRDVLSELPPLIHERMLRLAAEGVVGADAIFACLGPALEIFRRYSRLGKLAQSLSALCSAGTDEKRLVDGVLPRKKGLGL
jgi:putative DNA methylase